MVTLSPWEVEWLQSDQKVYAKPNHMPAWGQCPGLRRGQGGQQAQPQARGLFNRGVLLVPAGRASHAQAGLHPAGDGGRGRRLLGTVARLFPPRNQSAWSWPKPPERETNVHCRPREENCMRMGKLRSFHLAQLPWPDPCPLQALVEPPAAQSPGKALELSAKTRQRPGLRSLSLSVSSSAAWGMWVWEGLSAWGRAFKLPMQIVWVCLVIGTQGTCCRF